MSYKSAWFGYKSVEKISKHFKVATEELLDSHADGKKFDGAYGMNIEKKLAQKTSRASGTIANYLRKLCRPVKYRQL